MAVNTNDGFTALELRDILVQMTDELSKLIRDRPADGVRDIDGGGSSLDDRFADFH